MFAIRKPLFILLFTQLFALSLFAQITLRSNGYKSEFKRIDSLFFTEYKGRKGQISNQIKTNKNWHNKILQLDSSSFGIITKQKDEADTIDQIIGKDQRQLQTSYYVYLPDGTLQAPTSTLYFIPKSHSDVQRIFEPFGVAIAHTSITGAYYLRLNTAIYNTGDKILELCNSIFDAGLVELIEPVFVRRIKLNTDPLQGTEWNITNTGQYSGTAGADMKVNSVWNMGITGSGVKVAVIDCGVDLNHPDLQANLLPGYDATGNSSAGGPEYNSNNAHGTYCAGVIGEIKNGVGGIGVAYNAKIIPIRLGIVDIVNNNLQFINVAETNLTSSFDFALNQGADIISNSWGGFGSYAAQIDQRIQNAVTNGRGGKGAIVLFGSGNTNSSVEYPASNPNVIAVGASTMCDTRKRSSTDPLGVSCDGENWWGSNFGSNLDVLAPGVKITTTDLPVGSDYTNAYTNSFWGTSAACPNAAGVMALILSANPNLTGQQARNILEQTCDKVGGYTYQSNVSGQPNGTWSTDAGYGRINALAAVRKALGCDGNFSISGNTSVCTSGQYTLTVDGTPYTGAVTWTSSNNSIATVSATGNPATVTRISDGLFTLSATTTCSPLAISRYNLLSGACAAVTIKNNSPAGTGAAIPGYAKFIHPQYGEFTAGFGGAQNTTQLNLITGIYNIELGFAPGGGSVLIDRNGSQQILQMNGSSTTVSNVSVGNGYYVYGYNPYYSNTSQSGSFTRNNCPSGQAGSSITYTVPAGTYYGGTQSEADTKAVSDVNTNGQNYANTNGTCAPAGGVSVTNNTGSIKVIEFKQGSTVVQTVVSTGNPGTITPTVAPGTYTLHMYVPGGGTAQWTVNGSSQTGGDVSFNNITVGGSPVQIIIDNSWSFALYPNPADDNLTLEVKESDKATNASKDENTSSWRVQLTDKIGFVLKEYSYKKGSKLTIDISQFKQDIYYIKVFDGKKWNGRSFMKK